MKLKLHKGITLIEMIIAVSLLSIVFIIAVNILNIGVRTLEMSNRSFDVQATVRNVSSVTRNTIRYATTVFTVPAGSFRPDNLENGWSYLGIEDVMLDGQPATEIVQYRWNPATGTHIREVMVAARRDVVFRLEFAQEVGFCAVTGNMLTDQDLTFQIVGYLNGDTSRPYITIEGATVAANTLQVIDSGTAFDRAVAIAFRGDDRPGVTVGHVAFILDVSGSMAWDMNGNETWMTGQPSRMSIMQSAAITMITAMAAHDNIDISLVPFSHTANDPHPFRNTQLETSTLTSAVSALTAGGGTNTGDAIRRAHYQLRAHNQTLESGVTARNYLIVLVDGDTTMASVRPFFSHTINSNTVFQPADYFFGDGNLQNPAAWIHVSDPTGTRNPWVQGNVTATIPAQIVGHGSERRPFTCGYVEAVSRRYFPPGYAKVFIVALSSSVSAAGIQQVQMSLQAQPSNVFRANDAEALHTAFTSIMNEITSELWHLNGPRL